MFLSVLPFGTVPKRKGGENAFGFWNWNKERKTSDQVLSTVAWGGDTPGGQGGREQTVSGTLASRKNNKGTSKMKVYLIEPHIFQVSNSSGALDKPSPQLSQSYFEY